MRRTMLLVAAMAALFAAVAVPAAARPGADPASGNDKVTICHATRSLTNPYVVITIDAAAWNPDQDFNGPKHGEILHAREKNGKTWTDVFLGVGEIDVTPAECPEPAPPTTTTTTTTIPVTFPCGNRTFAYVVNFPEYDRDTNSKAQLFHHGPLTAVADDFGLIPEGDYDVWLASWDVSHPDGNPEGQAHEQWFADFGSIASELSKDLASSEGSTVAEAVLSPGGSVYISDTTKVTATHRSKIVTDDHDPDSVIPLCVGLNISGG